MDTVLIVDDEPDLLEGLRAVLEHEGFRVVACSDGHEARLRVFEDPPDIIISDVRMPGMDGWELVRELHQLPLTQHTPFLFLTGHVDPNTFSEALRSGVDGVMAKPIKSSELVAAVRTRLERSRAIGREGIDANALFRASLARTLPHGLNTSLHIIGGYAALLSSHIPGTDIELQSYVRKIEDASRRLQSSLEKLWLVLSLEEQFADFLGGRDKREPGTSALRPTVQAVATELSQAMHRSASIENSVPDVTVRIGDQHLKDLIREIVENAFLFSDHSRTVSVSGAVSPRAATLTVTDHGRGITKEAIEGLSSFEEFQRQRFEMRGHGLGLTIIHRILRLNNGDIRIVSTPGEGTSVSVVLPLDVS